MKYCSKCGEKLDTDSIYCIKCGVKVKRDIETQKKHNNDISKILKVSGIIFGIILLIVFFLGTGTEKRKKTINDKIGQEIDSDNIDIVSENDFTPDWNDGEKNIEGNSSWNMCNHSRIAEQGEWIYYLMDSGLYKEDSSGNKFLICETESTARNLSVTGDWIFFSNNAAGVTQIQKVRTDGKIRSELPNCLRSYYIYNDRIYYCTVEQTGAKSYDDIICSSDLDFNNVIKYKVFSSSDLGGYKDIGRSLYPIFIGVYDNKLYFTMRLYIDEGLTSKSTVKGMYYIDLQSGSVVQLLDEESIKQFEGINSFGELFIVDNIMYSNCYGFFHMFNLDSLENEDPEKYAFSYKIWEVGYNKELETFIMEIEDNGIWLFDKEGLTTGRGSHISTDTGISNFYTTSKYLYYDIADHSESIAKYPLYRIDYFGNNWEAIE